MDLLINVKTARGDALPRFIICKEFYMMDRQTNYNVHLQMSRGKLVTRVTGRKKREKKKELKQTNARKL